MTFGWVLLLDVGTRMVDGESRSEAQKGGEDEKEVGRRWDRIANLAGEKLN